MIKAAENIYSKMLSIILAANRGTYLNIARYAREFGVSSTLMREVFLCMYSEGLLESIPKVGFFIKDIDLQELMMLYNSRKCVEDYVIPQIIVKLDDKDLEILKSKIRQLQQSWQKKDLIKFMEIDDEFHYVLIERFENDTLTEFYRVINNQIRLASRNRKVCCGTLIKEYLLFLDKITEKQFEEASRIFKRSHEKSRSQITSWL